MQRQARCFRGLVVSLLGIVSWTVGHGLVHAQTNIKLEPRVENHTAWYNVEQWGVEGRGWNDTKRYFDRLPAKAEGKVRGPVWKLSHHSTGMSVLFRTDATQLWVRYRLLSQALDMPHMPASGVSGLDLYARDEQNRWRWVAVNGPTNSEDTVQLVSGLPSELREYRIYLPLYNGVEFLEIGVPEASHFIPVPPRTTKPLVFYGTSICHGGCASRPGMAWVNIASRKLDRPGINLGFGGNGTMDGSVGGLLVELDAAAYVIDCLPNMDARMVAERAVPLVHQIRAVRPETPILLVEDRFYTDGWIRSGRRRHNEANHAELHKAYEQLIADGVKRLFYVSANDLLGDDNDATVDGSHPTDLGMMRQAETIVAVLRQALDDSGRTSSSK